MMWLSRNISRASKRLMKLPNKFLLVKNPITRRTLDPEELAKLKSLSLDELIKQLETASRLKPKLITAEKMDRHRRYFTFRSLRTKSCPASESAVPAADIMPLKSLRSADSVITAMI